MKSEDFKNKKQAPDTIATGYREIETFTNGGSLWSWGISDYCSTSKSLGKTTFALNMIINNVDKLANTTKVSCYQQNQNVLLSFIRND